MKTKYLLTALALPALFAACSQEDIVTDANLPQSSELLGEVAGDVAFTFGPESRLTWGATGAQTWEANDEFSLFWTGDANVTPTTKETEANTLKGAANALYKKDGSTFTSENILYKGKHLMVYPVNKTHLGSDDIVVSVGSEQDGSLALGKRSVYVNDSLLTIDAEPKNAKDKKAGIIYAAGYKQPVQAAVKPLSSNLVLNLNFDMPSTISEVTVKDVTIEAYKADDLAEVFAADGYITSFNDSVGFKAKATSGSVKVKMPANTKVTKDNNTYTAQIALLPMKIADDAVDSMKIKVSTNYGIVTIDSAKYVTDKNGTYLFAGNTAEAQKKTGFKVADARLDLTDEFKLTYENGAKYTYRGTDVKPTKAQESFGKRITANVTVKMSEASISNMVVANSQELIDAYATYTLLGKTGAESFILSSKTPFELTPAAVTAILRNSKVTLTQELTGGKTNDTIKLTGAHTSIPSFIVKANDKNVKLFDTKDVALILGAEGTWALDVDVARAANTWKEIINAGTLTLSESNPLKKDGKTEDTTNNLTKTLKNQGTVVISGNVALPTAYTQTAGTTTVGENANLTTNKAAVNIDGGKVSVAGYWGITGNTVTNKGTIEVAGILNTEENKGTFTNLKTIKLQNADAIVVVTNNDDDTVGGKTIGSIESFARNSFVNVFNIEKQGYIKWNCDVTEYESKGDDTFNYAVLSGSLNVKNSQGNLVHIELAEGKRVNLTESIKENGKLALNTVIIKKNATLVVPYGSDVTYKTLDNKGNTPIIGGTFTKVTE